jgi:hypothetical protein
LAPFRPCSGGEYLPAGHADAVDADFALSLMQMALKWYAVPGERRFAPNDARPGRDHDRPDSEQRAAMRMQVKQFTVPPESILIGRMHGIVAVVLEQLRADADWGAIAAEYAHGAAPANQLGQGEADFVARRGRTQAPSWRPPTRRFPTVRHRDPPCADSGATSAGNQRFVLSNWPRPISTRAESQ